LFKRDVRGVRLLFVCNRTCDERDTSSTHLHHMFERVWISYVVIGIRVFASQKCTKDLRTYWHAKVVLIWDMNIFLGKVGPRTYRSHAVNIYALIYGSHKDLAHPGL
jgi:hypothetical protein